MPDTTWRQILNAGGAVMTLWSRYFTKLQTQRQWKVWERVEYHAIITAWRDRALTVARGKHCAWQGTGHSPLQEGNIASDKGQGTHRCKRETLCLTRALLGSSIGCCAITWVDYHNNRSRADSIIMLAKCDCYCHLHSSSYSMQQNTRIYKDAHRHFTQADKTVCKPTCPEAQRSYCWNSAFDSNFEPRSPLISSPDLKSTWFPNILSSFYKAFLHI
jgi:hypothetical protein